MSESVPPLQRVGVQAVSLLPEGHATLQGIDVLTFGNFELDVVTGELRREGRLLHLRHQPVSVLRMLLERAGELVTRREITAALWPDDIDVDVEQGLNHCMKEIRAALGDRPEAPRFIQTLPRRGYRFLGGVQAARGTRAPKEIKAAVRTHAAGSEEPKLRLQLMISRSSDGAVLWSAQYERSPHEAALLEHDAAAGVRAAAAAVIENRGALGSLDDPEPPVLDRRFE